MVEASHTAGLWPALMDPLRSMGARIADGVLTIRIPKKTTQPEEARRIAIRGA